MGRALQYVLLARSTEIGQLVLAMPLDDKRRVLYAAFKSIMLDDSGRSRRRSRSIKVYELSAPLNAFILQYSSE